MAADQAFDADALIPPEANRVMQRDFDRHQYQHRNPLERLFCRIKEFRGIATRLRTLRITGHSRESGNPSLQEDPLYPLLRAFSTPRRARIGPPVR